MSLRIYLGYSKAVHYVSLMSAIKLREGNRDATVDLALGQIAILLFFVRLSLDPENVRLELPEG